MALPPRVFFTLHEAAARWGCPIADIAGWAAIGKLKIMTGIGLVRCGEVEVAGQVILSPMELLPLFRRSGTCPVEGVVRRIMPVGGSDWLVISEPAGGVAITVADMLILADDVQAFEEDHDVGRRPAISAVAGSSYDWEGMNVALIRRIHNHGLPSTQAELIADMQDWFADQTDGTRMPDSRSIRRRITPIWHALRTEDA